jgi:Ca-activated chloride channel homolog
VSAPFFYEPIASTGENAGIESIARTSQSTVFVRVANYGRADRDLRVELLADGQLADVLPIRVAGNSTGDLSWDGLVPGTQTVEARLTPGDALTIDDAAFLVTGSPPAKKVLLVTEENSFLQRALKLRQGVDLTVVKKADYKPGGGFDLYVFDGWVPPGPLPAPALVIAPVDGNGPVPLGGPVAPGPVLPGDPTDAITQDVILKDVHVQTAAKVGVPSGWRAAISAVGDPLLLVHLGEPRIAELTFDLHHSDLPLRAAFPILVQNLLNYLLPSGFENQSYPTGRSVTLAAEPGARSIDVVEPSGKVVRLGPPFPAAPFSETETPGVYTVRQQLAAGRRVSSFVVQFQDPDLSRIAVGAEPFVNLAASAAGAAPRGTLELWPWFAAFALALLSIEWVVFHRGP